MAQLTVTVPDAQVAEVLAAVERVWRADAERMLAALGLPAYDTLTARQKGQALIAAFLRVMTRNQRIELAEEAARVSATDPDVT